MKGRLAVIGGALCCSCVPYTSSRERGSVRNERASLKGRERKRQKDDNDSSFHGVPIPKMVYDEAEKL